MPDYIAQDCRFITAGLEYSIVLHKHAPDQAFSHSLMPLQQSSLEVPVVHAVLLQRCSARTLDLLCSY